MKLALTSVLATILPATTFWSGGYSGQLQATNYDNFRFYLRILPGQEPKLVVGWGNDQCLWFGNKNVTRMTSHSICEPLTIDVPGVRKEWWDPLNDPRSCTGEFVPTAAREIYDSFKRGGEAEAQIYLIDVIEMVSSGFTKFAR